MGQTDTVFVTPEDRRLKERIEQMIRSHGESREGESASAWFVHLIRDIQALLSEYNVSNPARFYHLVLPVFNSDAMRLVRAVVADYRTSGPNSDPSG